MGEFLEIPPKLDTLIPVYEHARPSEHDNPSPSDSPREGDGEKKSNSKKRSKTTEPRDSLESKKRGRSSKGDSGKSGSQSGKKNGRKTTDQGSDSSDEDVKERGRFRWTDGLHQYFLACIFEMGLEAASPKKVYNKMMADPNFARSILDDDMSERVFDKESTNKFGAHHVKSHLQRFRSNVANPKLLFIDQLVCLMEQAKERKNEEKQSNRPSKVLNPEYHTYPFSPDRAFPDGLLQESQESLTGDVYTGFSSISNNQINSTGDSSSAAAAAPLTTESRPRALSMLSGPSHQQMLAQVAVREMIESKGLRQTMAASQSAQVEDLDNIPSAFHEDNDLFDWLTNSEFESFSDDKKN